MSLVRNRTRLGSIGRRGGALVLLGLWTPGMVQDADAQTVGCLWDRLPVEQASGAIFTHRLEILHPPVPQQQITEGITWYFQGWFRDGPAAAGYGLTGALRLRFTP